ncbi:MAG: PAS domain S-box protein [Halobacteria archaeon]
MSGDEISQLKVLVLGRKELHDEGIYRKIDSYEEPVFSVERLDLPEDLEKELCHELSDKLKNVEADCILCRHDPPDLCAHEVREYLDDILDSTPFLVAGPRKHLDGVYDSRIDDVIELVDGEIHPEVAVNRVKSLVSSSRGKKDGSILKKKNSLGRETGKKTKVGLDRATDKKTKDSLERTLNRICDGFVAINDDRELSYMNDQGHETVCDFLGENRGKTELLGTSVRKVLSEAGEDLVSSKYQEAVSRQEPVTFENYYEPSDAWYEVHIYPDEHGVSVFFTDVTERKSRERSLKRYRESMDTVSDVVVTIDEERIIQYINPAVEDVLGYTQESLTGEPITEIIPAVTDDYYRSSFTEFLEFGKRGIDWDYVEMPGSTVEGEEIPLGVSINEFEFEGKRYFTGVLRDITDREEREESLNALLDVTRDFISAATEQDLIEKIVEGVEDIFGYPVSEVRLYNDVVEELRTEIRSAGAQEMFDGADDGVHEDGISEAFSTGEPIVVEKADSGKDTGSMVTALHLPIGDHGVLTVASPDGEEFTEEKISLIEILSLGAATAFDRLEHEEEIALLQEIVDHLDLNVFLLNRDMEFRFITSPLSEDLGRSSGELTGTKFTEIVPDKYKERCMQALEDVELGESVSVKVHVFTTTGEKHPVEIELSRSVSGPSETEYAGVIKDISELVETKTDLKTARKKFRKLFENNPDPIAEIKYVDGDPVILDVNSAFARNFGFGKEIAEGANINNLIVPAEDDSAVPDRDSKAMEGKVVSDEVKRRTMKGKRYFLLRGIPYRKDEGDVHGFAIYTDISERKERERYLKIINRFLRHNLRNDMTVLTGISQEIEDVARNTRIVDYAVKLRDKTRELHDLSEEAREIKRVFEELNETSEVDVSGYIRDVVEDARHRYTDARIQLDAPQMVYVHGGEYLERAFEEIIENALDHNDSSNPRIDIEVKVFETWTEFRFRDNGPGIPENEWDVVTGRKEISQISHNTGLGLWLTRYIIDSYDGSMYYKEMEEGGSNVVLRLRTAT